MTDTEPLDWAEDEVIEGWVHGWASSRRTPPPLRVDAGWVVETSSARESRRFVLDCPDDAGLEAILAEQQPLNACIKFAGHPEWESRFSPDWVTTDPAWFMARHLKDRPTVSVRPGFAVQTQWVSGSLVTAEIRTENGDLAARAQMGLGSGFAVPDQVVTEPGYRRRGFGSVLMSHLEHAAVEVGVSQAVLGATVDGRRLYEKLGWQTVADLRGRYHRPPR